LSGLPYLLQHLHKNLQRSGSLALCLAHAKKSRALTATQLAEAYAAPLQRRVRVAPDSVERVATYLTAKGLAQRSGETGRSDKEATARRLATGEISVEAQDWFLSDPALPSSTGRENRNSFAETVTACVDLRLLTEQTLTLASYGELLLAIAEDTGLLQGLTRIDANPFLPNRKYVTAVMFQVLRCDLPMQRELVRALPDGYLSFTQHLAPMAQTILRNAGAQVARTAANRDVTDWIHRQAKSAEALARREYPGQRVTGKQGRAVAPQTVLRPLEDIFLPRMELLVDAGLLRKPVMGDYAYVSTESLAAYRRLIDGGSNNLESHFFTSFGEIYGFRPAPIHDPQEVAEHLRVAATKFKGLTGYSGIAESTVYANVQALGDPWRFVELGVSLTALRTLASAEKPTARVIADRFRRPRDFALLS